MNAQVIKATIYWAFAGAMMGLGIVSIFSIGIPVVLIGIFFMSYGLAKMDHRGLWAAFVSVVAIPGGLMLYNNFEVHSDEIPPTGNNIPLVLLAFVIVAIAYMALGVFQHSQASKVSG